MKLLFCPLVVQIHSPSSYNITLAQMVILMNTFKEVSVASRICLTCSESTTHGFHLCRSWIHVFHPDELMEANRNVHPLEKLSSNDMYEIYGEDTKELERSIEANLAESEAAYFRGPLTYRVELLSVFGLGHRGAIDFRAIETDGPDTADLDKVLEFLNSESVFSMYLSKDEVYLCRLVSVDAEGIRYVWNVYRLEFSDRWSMTAWN